MPYRTLFAATSCVTACSVAGAVIDYGYGFTLAAGIFSGAATLGGLGVFCIAVEEVTERLEEDKTQPTHPINPPQNGRLGKNKIDQ